MNAIDPKQFNLPPKTLIEEINKNHFALIVQRKSRIIMADGKKLIEKADRIRDIKPGIKISLKTSTPICSKTIKFLGEHGINVLGSK